MQNEKNLPATTAAIPNVDALISHARNNPRDEIECMKQVKKLATLSRSAAMNCIYYRPVGKKNGKQQFAEGGSIRLAELIQTKWKNLYVDCRTLEPTEPGTVLGGALVVDLENLSINRDESTGSIKKSNGETFGPAQIEVKKSAVKQIAKRNALFGLVSKIVVNEILKDVKDKIMGGEDAAEAWKKGVNVFGSMGVSEQQLLQAVGAPNKSSVTRDNVCKLHGIFNAIKDGLVEAEACFGKVGKPRVTQPTKKKSDKEGKKETPKEENQDANEGRAILAEAYESTRKALVDNGHTEAANEVSIRFLKAKYPGDPMEVEDKDVSGAIDLLSTIASELGGKE